MDVVPVCPYMAAHDRAERRGCACSRCLWDRRRRPRHGGAGVRFRYRGVVLRAAVRHRRARPRRRTGSLTRTSGGLRTQLRGDSLSVGSGSAAITLTSTAQRGGAWTRHRSGATRKTRFGSQAVVFATGLAEEFFVVDRRLGRRTWQWRLEPGRWTPRIGADGGVSFGAAGTLGPLAIQPPQIFDRRGRDVTPTGTRWALRRVGGVWRLQLRVVDSSLPIPYVIDPAVTHRASATATNGSGGASSLTLTRPTATSVRDLLVAQVAARGGSAMTIDTPAGWTKALDTASDTTLRQATFYRVGPQGTDDRSRSRSGAPPPRSRRSAGSPLTTGSRGPALVDRHAETASTGTSATALAASITTTLPGSLVVTAFAAATGTGFSTPSGTTERYDAQSSGASGARASVASHSFVQAAAGPTGAKSSTLTSSRWLAHLLSFAVDDVVPTVTIADPGANLRATITLEAGAADVDSGVARVQFQRALAGSGTWVNVGSAVATAPYRVSFDTRTVCGRSLRLPRRGDGQRGECRVGLARVRADRQWRPDGCSGVPRCVGLHTTRQLVLRLHPFRSLRQCS